MSENLKSDRESNNTTKHIESTKLDSANKGEVRLDSNGDEIVYEIWHNPNWWDYFLMSVFLCLVLLWRIVAQKLFCLIK